MKEGQLDDFRNFRQASKEVGYDDDERKLIAVEPSLVLEEASDSLREKVTPEIISSFFEAIMGKKDIDDNNLVALGRFLYNFRPDIKAPNMFEEKDVRLINLGCVLLENSFYSGQIFNLDKKATAAMAFVVNVLAKIFERDDLPSGLIGFKKEKLEDFVTSVRQFEEKELFPDGPDPERKASARRRTIEDLDREILDLLNQAKETLANTNWEDYFYYEASDRLMKDYDLLASQGKDFRLWLNDIIHFRDFIALPSFRERLIGQIRVGIRALEAEEKGVVGLNRQINTSEDTFLFRRGSIHRIVHEDIMTEDERYEYGCSPDTFAALLKKIQQKIDQTQKEEGGKKKQIISSFAELGQNLAPQILPEILADLQSFVGEYGDDVLGSLLKKCREVGRLIVQRESLKNKDNNYQIAEQRLRQGMDGNLSSALLYLLKTSLIVKDMIADEEGKWDPNSFGGRDLASGRKGESLYRYSGGQTPVHDFLLSKGDSGPAYARLHILPEDIPLSFWILNYFDTRSK